MSSKQLILDLFDKAAELRAEQRGEFLRTATTDDEARSSVLRLLAHHDQATDFLARPAVETFSAIAQFVGNEVGEFRLIREIGRGGMGVVYLAEDLVLKREVAVKVLGERVTASPQALARFRQEAQAAARLSHPNIVPIHRYGVDAGIHFIVMPYVPGTTLEQRLSKHRDTADAAKRASQPQKSGDAGGVPVTVRQKEYFRECAGVAGQVAGALAYAHENNVLHCDIKPSNIMITSGGEALLADFGIARLTDEERITQTGELTGTLCYMSPEQAAGHSLDGRSDVFSLGVVLFESLTLQRPEHGSNGTAKAALPVRNLNPAVDVDLGTICNKALEAIPADRYPTAAHLAADLGSYLRGEPILARPTGLLRRVRRTIARRRRQSIALALAVVAAGAGTVAAMRYEAYQQTLGHVVLRTSSGGAIAALTTRHYDASGEVFARPSQVADPPFNTVDLPGGLYRFRAVNGAGWVAEFDDFVSPGVMLDRDLRFLPTAEAVAGMVRFDAGVYTVWKPDSQGALERYEVVSDGFYMDVAEVSNREYADFLAATGAPPPRMWVGGVVPSGADDLPVVALWFREMVAFAVWQGKRLPTLGEWQIAYSAPDGRARPWGAGAAPDEIRPTDAARCAKQRSGPGHLWESYLTSTLPVLSVPAAATPTGLFHMYGNVREVTGTVVSLDPQNPAADAAAMMLAGADWTRDPDCFEPAFKAMTPLFSISPIQGFRCARSLGGETTNAPTEGKK